MATLRGEALLAVTGVTLALRPGPVRINQEVLGRAEGIERAIRRRLRKFVREPKFSKPEKFPPFDYEEVMGLLPRADSEVHNAENVSRFQDPQLVSEYADALGAALGYVQGIAPAEKLPAMVGGHVLEPSSLDVSEFRRRYSVADRPLVVLDDLAAGILVPDQVEAFAQVYPQLHGLTRTAVLDEMVVAGRERVSWALPYAKDQTLQILLQTDTIDQRLHGELSKAFDEARAKEAAGQKSARAPGAGGSPMPARNLNDPSTASQRSEAK